MAFCFHSSSLPSPLSGFSEIAGPKEMKNQRGSPPPDSNPFSYASLERILPACQAQSQRPRITDSSSINAISLFIRTHNDTFSSRDARQQSRSFARENQLLRRSPNSNRLY